MELVGGLFLTYRKARYMAAVSPRGQVGDFRCGDMVMPVSSYGVSGGGSAASVHEGDARPRDVGTSPGCHIEVYQARRGRSDSDDD